MATTIIRDLNPGDLAIIDQNADKKNVSREEYLRQLIHSQAQTYFIDEDHNNLVELFRKNDEVLAQATNAINSFVELLKSK